MTPWFIGFVAAHLDLLTVVWRWRIGNHSLWKHGSVAAKSAIRRQPHAAVLGQQRQIRRRSKRFPSEIESQPSCEHVVAVT